MKYGFKEVEFRRIQFSTAIENIKPQKAIANLGAKKEGVFRDNYVDPNENSKGDIYFSSIAAEWASIKESYFSDFQ